MQNQPLRPSRNKPLARARSLDGFAVPSPQDSRHLKDDGPYAASKKISPALLSDYLKGGSQPAPVVPARKLPVQAANKRQAAAYSAQKPQRPQPQAGDDKPLQIAVPYRSANTVSEDRRVARSKKRKAHKHPRLRRVLLSTAGVVSALVLVSVGWLGWKFLNNSSKIFGGSVLSNIGGLLNGAPLKGQESGRVNILLAGNSKDDIGHDGADLTDSIMVISIDTNNNRAFMLSIPRDFWVNIPGVGYRKINEANYWGDQNDFSENGYATGGMGLLEKTIEQAFGLHMNYYALISYNAFKDAVDAVGGITVDIESDDARGLYDPTFKSWEGGALKLSNGKHTLDGTAALKLARARGHDGGYGFASSDFTRTENQRKMLLALKDKALSAGVVSNPIKLGNLMDSIGNNVKTDFKLNEITTLVGVGKKLTSIDSLSLQDKSVQLLANYTTPLGQSALIPAAGVGDYDDIIDFLQRNLSSDPLVREAAAVTVLNGTDMDGLAGSQRSILEKKKLNVVDVDTSSKTYDKTTIIIADGAQKPASLALLSTVYDGAVVIKEAAAQQDVPYGSDFVVILGKDFASSHPVSDSSQ